MRRRARIVKELASRADQRVLRWIVHVERMDEYHSCRMVEHVKRMDENIEIVWTC